MNIIIDSSSFQMMMRTIKATEQVSYHHALRYY